MSFDPTNEPDLPRQGPRDSEGGEQPTRPQQPADTQQPADSPSAGTASIAPTGSVSQGEGSSWQSQVNPYRVANPDAPAGIGRGEIPEDAMVVEVDSRRPRSWSAIAVVFLSLGAFLVMSGIAAAVSVWGVHGELNVKVLRDPESMKKVTQSRFWLTVLVVIPQLAMVAPAVFAAALSSRPTRERLGLVRGHWPIWAWIAAAVATPLVGLISSVIIGALLEPSESLEQMSSVFRDHGANGFLFPLALMIGATPAICEELLFRGYVQTRLTRSWGPIAGILMASGLFAIFHMDLVHVIAVFPLGMFLGFVSWRSGSLFPAMMGHFVNNVISVVAVVLAPEDQSDITLAMPVAFLSLGILGLGFLGAMAVIAATIAYPAPQSDPPTALLVSTDGSRL